MLRDECKDCAQYGAKTPNGCMRIAHGMGCVLGPLPPGAVVYADRPKTIADMAARVTGGTTDKPRVEVSFVEKSALDTQVGGGHYKDLPIQPVEFITKNKLGFLEGCVIKRMCRWRGKNGIEDLKKAIHEIELLIELESKNG